MFDNEKFSQLKKIQVNREKKEEDFTKIQQRLDSKPFHWQIPAAIIAIACITLFLAGTFPAQKLNTSVDLNKTAVQVVYYIEGEGDPSTSLRAGVKKVKNEETLLAIEGVLKQMQPETIGLDEALIYQSYRIKFENNTVLRLQQYWDYNQSYFKDLDTGQVYSLSENPLHNIISQYETDNKKRQLTISVVFFAIAFFVNGRLGKKLRDPYDPKRKIPMHSTHWQSVVEILSFLILIMMILFPQIHLFAVIAMLLLSALINIVLEARHDNNKWRMLQFLMSKLMIGIYLYIVLWKLL
ncbi:signal recognition particle [Solibacillus silvestris]|uniref:signal recognition particle n=1 Tax=Solibacillus silvestris TaxID=76853 RepID=UPI003F7DA5DF